MSLFQGYLRFLLVLHQCLTLVNPSCEVEKDVFARDMLEDDVIFSDDVMWMTSRCGSMACCASHCLQNPFCVAFNTNFKNPANTVCQGYSSHPSGGQFSLGNRLYVRKHRTIAPDSTATSSQPSEIPTTQSSEFTTTQSSKDSTVSGFVTDSTDTMNSEEEEETTQVLATTQGQASSWLNTACSSDSKCHSLQDNTECFLGKCMCTPGYYYSLSTFQCLTSCPTSDLQTEFLAYKNYVLWGYSLTGFPKQMSLTGCLGTCIDSSTRCPSVDYKPDSGTCGAGIKSRFDLPAQDWKNNQEFVYYQRTCL